MKPKTAPSPAPQASIGRTVRAVAWSFLGVRKKSGLQDDMAQLNPLHLIAVGVVAAIVFVLGLIALVNWVVAP